MQEDVDINLLIQSYSQKVLNLTNELILKDTMIKQLTLKIDQLTNTKEDE